jgi:phosphopantothenoylcysteine decarboxylase/phosphopantothenate--cysteine ligase
VRFIGNHSTGKMGYAIAEAFAKKGAEVILVSGPVSGQQNLSNNINLVNITSAEELYNESVKVFKDADIAVCAAAVADYKPAKSESQKIKKQGETLTLELVKTKDTLAALGTLKKDGQLLIGFALETNNETEHALKKLVAKNLDFIVLNSLNDQGAGFKHDTNKVSFIHKNNKVSTFELKSKAEVAEDLVNEVINILP